MDNRGSLLGYIDMVSFLEYIGLNVPYIMLNAFSIARPGRVLSASV